MGGCCFKEVLGEIYEVLFEFISVLIIHRICRNVKYLFFITVIEIFYRLISHRLALFPPLPFPVWRIVAEVLCRSPPSGDGLMQGGF